MKKLVALSFAFIAALVAAPSTWAQAPVSGGVTKSAGLHGDENGKVAMCTGCHGIPGYQASFPEVYKVPKIAGQNSAYLVSALMEYRKGERRHPTMRSIAAGLTDTDMTDLANYYEQLGKSAPVEDTHAAPEPSPLVATLLAKSGCVACHGAGFAAPVAPGYPKLAGQYEDYLYVALKSYQIDHNDRMGRSNAIMMGMARPYTHAELKALAAYISSLPGSLKTVAQSRFR